MEAPPLVSVIIIFLNEEKCISEAIESVLAQTYEQWEILLVDDGSTDRSTTIARSFARKMPDRIRYLEHSGHENKGMSASRNLGIRNAQGQYLSFLDADDLWLPQKLEQQLAILEAQPEAALVCGRAQWWYSWTGEAEDQKKDFIQAFQLPLDTLVAGYKVLLMFLQDEWASLHDILLRREAVDAVGGYEDAFRGMYEDQAFHAKLCLTYPVFVSGACAYRYRQHPEACTTQTHANGKYLAARKTYLYWLQDLLIDQKDKVSEVWQVVQQQLWPFKPLTCKG
ncbi:MAG: glycosyltransferase family A protein [Saprospiraceae bacterium]